MLMEKTGDGERQSSPARGMTARCRKSVANPRLIKDGSLGELYRLLAQGSKCKGSGRHEHMFGWRGGSREIVSSLVTCAEAVVVGCESSRGLARALLHPHEPAVPFNTFEIPGDRAIASKRRGALGGFGAGRKAIARPPS
ncbi:hypothetical protein CIHG_05917 [Coccidioides immitis H538.4]|uniref:Uncharacterized protein n=1 Tax=Coccidioides immitis H538.4 TaxID=396776 RepID=A0A0J8RU34_COCIT|nr:hypothetical protein CIHG_05917 [Coccidioides immitis H538.4]